MNIIPALKLTPSPLEIEIDQLENSYSRVACALGDMLQKSFDGHSLYTIDPLMEAFSFQLLRNVFGYYGPLLKKGKRVKPVGQEDGALVGWLLAENSDYFADGLGPLLRFIRQNHVRFTGINNWLYNVVNERDKNHDGALLVHKGRTEISNYIPIDSAEKLATHVFNQEHQTHYEVMYDIIPYLLPREFTFDDGHDIRAGSKTLNAFAMSYLSNHWRIEIGKVTVRSPLGVGLTIELRRTTDASRNRFFHYREVFPTFANLAPCSVLEKNIFSELSTLYHEPVIAVLNHYIHKISPDNLKKPELFEQRLLLPAELGQMNPDMYRLGNRK